MPIKSKKFNSIKVTKYYCDIVENESGRTKK